MATNTRTQRKAVSEQLDEMADAIENAPKAPKPVYVSAEERRQRERRERVIGSLVSETRNGGAVVLGNPRLSGADPYARPKIRRQNRLAFHLSIDDVADILRRAGVETTADVVTDLEDHEYGDAPNNNDYWNTEVATAYRRFLKAIAAGPVVEVA